jgi:hypothetical protein
MSRGSSTDIRLRQAINPEKSLARPNAPRARTRVGHGAVRENRRDSALEQNQPLRYLSGMRSVLIDETPTRPR